MNNSSYILDRLEWDSKYFNLKVYSLELVDELTNQSWDSIKREIYNYDLIYIKNPTYLRKNSELISKNTNAVLYDTNISFELSNFSTFKNGNDENIHQSFLNTWKIDNNFHFPYSRFVKDKRLNNIIGEKIYDNLLLNSIIDKTKKTLFYVIKNQLIGYLIYKLSKNKISIELLAIDDDYKRLMIGSKLISNLVELAKIYDVTNITVGTQISNVGAINFYIKNNFRVKSSFDIYHLWF